MGRPPLSFNYCHFDKFDSEQRLDHRQPFLISLIYLPHLSCFILSEQLCCTLTSLFLVGQRNPDSRSGGREVALIMIDTLPVLCSFLLISCDLYTEAMTTAPLKMIKNLYVWYILTPGPLSVYHHQRLDRKFSGKANEDTELGTSVTNACRCRRVPTFILNSSRGPKVSKNRLSLSTYALWIAVILIRWSGL